MKEGNMEFSPLTAISPVDGRYRTKCEKVAEYFSEFALIRYRLKIEVEYFIALCEIPLPPLKDVSKERTKDLRGLYENFSIEDAQRIKEIEKTTNHDVKAVEYYLKDKLIEFGLEDQKEFVHFGLTSQDINNTAIPMALRDVIQQVYRPLLSKVINKLLELADEWQDIAMLARTHGQPASPTRLGKELHVFVERLEVQLDQLERIPFSAKFGGATGNFNAHHAAYPHIDWIGFANDLVDRKLELKRSQTTTQIEHYDNMAAVFDALQRSNTILIDLDRDLWTYISMNYFKQKIEQNEVGSSAMPHKVNPIDLENSEGNLGIANALFGHLSWKLPVSRLQRDLTDSTVTRNIGVPISHTVLALESLHKGLTKLEVNEAALASDLDDNWEVVAEAIQTILRREGFSEPYEKLKELTRKSDRVDQESIARFIENLDVSEEVKKELKEISPSTYTGVRSQRDNQG